MRISKLKIIGAITVILGVSGALVVIIGGGVCLGGLTLVSTIKLGEFLSSHRLTLQKMMFYGSASTGAGLFLIGAGMGISQNIENRIPDQKLPKDT